MISVLLLISNSIIFSQTSRPEIKAQQAMESIVFQLVLITEEGLIGGIVEMEPGWKA